MVGSYSICRACRGNIKSALDLKSASIAERLSAQYTGRNQRAPQIEAQRRPISSTPLRSHTFTSSNTHAYTTPHYSRQTSPWTPRSIHPRAQLPSFSLQRRFQSTSPIIQQPAAVPPTDFGSDLLSDPVDAAQLAATGGAGDSWYIGYLRDILPDFGWGPTSTIEWLFEHMHIYAGTSIGVSIVLAAVALRMATFPTVLMAADTGARLQALASVTKPLQERMRASVVEKDQMKMQHARQEMSKVYREADIKLWKSFLSPLVQIPLGFGSWRLLRNMADIPVPGMETGGFLWFSNLTTYDPYFILPVATGLIQHISMRLGGESGAETTEASKQMRRVLVYGLPFLAPIFIGFAPAAIQLSFCTASILSFCTMALMRNPGARKFFNVSPLIKPKKIVNHTPYQGHMTVSNRLSTHPANLKAADARANSTAKRSNLFPKVDVKSLRNPFSAISRTMTDFVGEVMPSAQQQVKKRRDDRAQSRTDEHERKRSADVEKARERQDRFIERERRRKGGF